LLRKTPGGKGQALITQSEVLGFAQNFEANSPEANWPDALKRAVKLAQDFGLAEKEGENAVLVLGVGFHGLIMARFRFFENSAAAAPRKSILPEN